MERDLIIENLLNDVKEFDKKIDDNNIFAILNKERDERTHCRILRYLIETYWSDFCKYILHIETDEKLQYCVCEQHIEKIFDCEMDKDGSIDIFIETEHYVIPIEVKVDAEDQRIQLLRYFNYFNKKKKLKLIYLTPMRKEASTYSTTCEKSTDCKIVNCKQQLNKNNYVIKNYRDISSWLTEVIKNAEITQGGYYIAKCYKEVLDKKSSTMDTVEKILKGKNSLLAAKTIYEAYQDALNQIRDKFFEALAEELRMNGFSVIRINSKKEDKEKYKTINDINNTALIITDETANLKYTMCYSTNLYIRKNPENDETDWCYICRDWFDKISDTYNCKDANKVAVDVKNFDYKKYPNPVLEWYFSSNKEETIKILVNNIIKEFKA